MQVRYAGCLLAALLLGACGGSKDKGASSSRGSQRLDITARDFALKINGGASLRPGPVTIVARNSGKQAHGVVLVKLDDGVTTSALVTALKTKPADVGSMLSYVGGTTTLPTGSSWQGTTKFDAGNYAMVDVGVVKGGRLNYTRAGEVQGFTVSGRPLTTAAARPAVKVSLYDYGIQMPKVVPAKGEVRIENTGNDDHQLEFLRVSSAAEAERIIAAFKSGKATRTRFNPIEVLAPTSAATSTTVKYALPKGAYIAYCSYATAASRGQRHAALGMIAPFAVK